MSVATEGWSFATTEENMSKCSKRGTKRSIYFGTSAWLLSALDASVVAMVFRIEWAYAAFNSLSVALGAAQTMSSFVVKRMTRTSKSSGQWQSLLSPVRALQYLTRSAVAFGGGALSGKKLNNKGRVCTSICFGADWEMMASISTARSLKDACISVRLYEVARKSTGNPRTLGSPPVVYR